jgi:site-specific DNA-methyltransferase (adenine-specific)
MDLPPLPSDLYARLRDDIRHRGIQVPILVDGKTGQVIDERQRQRIAQELGIRDIRTIYVSRLSSDERDDLRVAVNLYRRHLTRAQMRELVGWDLKQRPESSDRWVAGKTGVNHRTVANVRRRLEAGGEILHLPERDGCDGKKYPAAKPTVFACSSAEGRRARALLDRLGDDAPARTASIRVLHKLLNRKERADLSVSPDARLPAHIKIECCDFRELPVPDGAVDLIFTDPPWGLGGRRLIPDFSNWAARKLKPDGGLLLIYAGHSGLLEVGGEIARRLTYLWTLSCHNGDGRGTNTRHDLLIRCCWRPILMFCRGEYHRPRQVFDDEVVSTDRDKTYHSHQQPLSEALFYVGALTGPRSTICDPFLGAGTTACAVARLGQGRRFWGSEIDAEACALARSRVAEEVQTGASPAARVATSR